MRLVKQLRDDPVLRQSFFDLARRTFGIAFEGWYEEGWWGGRYIPYALAEGDEVLANASVNRMDFQLDGQPFSCIQIGTVMTGEAHRNRGLARRLMEAVLEDYGHLPIYLFASDMAKGFYPKFGFRPAKEGRVRLAWSGEGTKGTKRVRRLDWRLAGDRELFLSRCRGGNPFARLTQVNGESLAAFYCRSELADCLYFDEAAGRAAAAEFAEGRMILRDIFGEGGGLAEAIAAFARPDTTEVVLDFLPKEPLGELSFLDGDLFLRGDWPDMPLLFPLLSRA
ncbi:GNAT family N-acetyltransferase [Gehongia tenuis]|uniref:GNAT family N-acetyltransferase n=1 Tax=Gehongia tenuis TaxID=2763655 RepID=A0A926HK84_9FIRM|nr:GNAT family N-acetyltransferase [Gehongia tenuis]MBC8530702.1 GNAT family N-acetyltransferase [Gehongia tenuis]